MRPLSANPAPSRRGLMPRLISCPGYDSISGLEPLVSDRLVAVERRAMGCGQPMPPCRAQHGPGGSSKWPTSCRRRGCFHRCRQTSACDLVHPVNHHPCHCLLQPDAHPRPDAYPYPHSYGDAGYSRYGIGGGSRGHRRHSHRHPGANPDAATDGDANPYPNANAYPNADAYSYPDSHADAYSHADTDAYSVADAHADAYPYSYTDAYPNADAHAYPPGCG